MIDKAKAIEILSRFPNSGFGDSLHGGAISVPEIIELLKEQEPVKPKQRNPNLDAWWYECGNCDTAISPSDNYCRGCGRAIDWNLQRT